ncbi:MAG: transcription termination factor NusA [Clostridiales bacterium]|jgi:N utilization substance protein A|nr:transcription termination factor NusA [Clostridiales bacterium]
MINKDFFLALEDLERTKGIQKSVFITALETALVNAYRRHTGIQKAIDVRLVPERNTIKIVAYQTVVEEVEDRETQISLEDARIISKKYKVGDIVSEEVSSKDFGRIAAQTAKQIILQKLREQESIKAIEDLVDCENTIMTCVARRMEGSTIFVEINKLEAQLSQADLMPNDKFKLGDRIKVYVKKIRATQRGPQILLTRSGAGFVKKLFELEVPELSSGVVTIKSIAREAGYRTKIAVATDNTDVDPVGAFVGNRGMRVNSIVSELGGEKIDIIPWCEDTLEFIARALNPAKVAMVQVNDNEKTAKVAVPDEQLSLAIGRDGQNARLAARLTGWKIDVKAYSLFAKAMQEEEIKEQSAENGTIDDVFLDELADI